MVAMRRSQRGSGAHAPRGCRVLRATALAAALAVAGCAGDGSGADGGDDGGGDALEPTLESIQAQVFDERCISCHSGSGAPQGLRLDDAQTSYDNLVDVASSEVPTTDRVEPGDPDNSYLIDKLEGTQSVGDRMPRGQPPLDAETIAVIRQWIADGAPPPASGKGLFLPPAALDRP